MELITAPTKTMKKQDTRTTEKFEIELTDTFGGEANYSWVHRETLEVPEGTSDRALVQRAKKLFGLTGCTAETQDYGDVIVRDFRPSGLSQVMFITCQHEELKHAQK